MKQNVESETYMRLHLSVFSFLLITGMTLGLGISSLSLAKSGSGHGGPGGEPPAQPPCSQMSCKAPNPPTEPVPPTQPQPEPQYEQYVAWETFGVTYDRGFSSGWMVSRYAAKDFVENMVTHLLKAECHKEAKKRYALHYDRASRPLDPRGRPTLVRGLADVQLNPDSVRIPLDCKEQRRGDCWECSNDCATATCSAQVIRFRRIQ